MSEGEIAAAAKQHLLRVAFADRVGGLPLDTSFDFSCSHSFCLFQKSVSENGFFASEPERRKLRMKRFEGSEWAL